MFDEYYNSKIMPKPEIGDFIDVAPGTLEYTQLLKELILCSDIESMERIAGNKNKTIRVINGGFELYLQTNEKENSKRILINRSFSKIAYESQEDGSLYSWDGSPLVMDPRQKGFFEVHPINGKPIF